jgi:DHA3 family tetracycline resistance protein-like MFS transporter
MLGRVSSLDWLVSIALMPLSFALTAPVAALVGVRATLIGAAVLGAAVTLGAYFLPGMTAIEQRYARGRGSWQVPVDVTD